MTEKYIDYSSCIRPEASLGEHRFARDLESEVGKQNCNFFEDGWNYCMAVVGSFTPCASNFVYRLASHTMRLYAVNTIHITNSR